MAHEIRKPLTQIVNMPPPASSMPGASDQGHAKPTVSQSVFDMTPHVDISFGDTFKQCETTQEFPFMRAFTTAIFSYTHYFVYATLALLVAPLAAIIWAVIFAVFRILEVWFIQPSIKFVFIWLRISGLMLEAVVSITLNPIYRSMSLALSNIRGRFQMNCSDINVTTRLRQAEIV